MNLQNTLAQLQPPTGIGTLYSLLQTSRVSINWVGARVVSIKSYADEVLLEQITAKFLQLVAHNPLRELSIEYRLQALWLQKKILELFVQADAQLAKTLLYQHMIPPLITKEDSCPPPISTSTSSPDTTQTKSARLVQFLSGTSCTAQFLQRQSSITNSLLAFTEDKIKALWPTLEISACTVFMVDNQQRYLVEERLLEEKLPSAVSENLSSALTKAHLDCLPS